ncbi:MAG TPA: AAA family ATPase [Nitrosopumilus sp.]|nr:AAA family ATPase [Thermoproteota archaeon]HJJ23504.1 AAA family ATPase [Nitrosopumilus sp.]
MSIVITGNPGVGKHTITQEIAEKLELSIIDINSIAKDAGLFEKNKDTNDVDTLKLEKILEQKISEKNVIVGHLAPYVLDKNKIKIMIVLRRNPYDLISVYKERKYTDKKSIENAGSEVLGVIAHDAMSKFQEKVFQIDTSEKSIKEVVKKVMTLISSNKGNEEVDWLDLVTKNNDLKKFFVD